MVNSGQIIRAVHWAGIVFAALGSVFSIGIVINALRLSNSREAIEFGIRAMVCGAFAFYLYRRRPKSRV